MRVYEDEFGFRARHPLPPLRWWQLFRRWKRWRNGRLLERKLRDIWL